MKTVEEKKIYKVISITNQVYYKKKEKKKRFPAMCYICTVSVRLFSHKELRMDLFTIWTGKQIGWKEFWMKFGAFHLLGALWTELSS